MYALVCFYHRDNWCGLVRILYGLYSVISQESIQLLVRHISHDMWQRPRIVVLGNSIVTWPHLFGQPGESPHTVADKELDRLLAEDTIEPVQYSDW